MCLIFVKVVVVVDALGRDSIRELVRRLGLSNLPIPSFLKALAPSLSNNDKRTVEQIQKLVRFLLGDFEGIISNDLQNSNPSLSRIQRAQQLATSRESNERLRKLIPVLREYSPQLRDFGTLLIARLNEKTLSRALNWATQPSRVMA